MSLEITHVGFSDESNWNIGRFRSLGLVTVPKEHLDHLMQQMGQLLVDSEITEFKWKKLKGARERFAAEKICNFAIEHAHAGLLRIDVLIWDIRDSRHDVQGRDDVENLQRMYYHLFRNVLRMRWPSDAVWQLYPDEHTAMDWQTVEDCLSAVSAHIEIERSLFTGGKFSMRLQQEFSIEKIVQSMSQTVPLLQVADLFAGLAVFSREMFSEYQKWLQSISPQRDLFANAPISTKLSKKSLSRFKVLKHFDDRCKKHSLGVSLKTKQGLWTPNPNNPINFWLYEPQHPGDKAPTRDKRRRDV